MEKQRIQAEPVYENAHRVAHDLLTRIGELLQDMPAPGAVGVRINWSHVGAISLVNDLLSMAVAHLDEGHSNDH